jgi:hypothetical protein
MEKKAKKKYICIAKINSYECVKYRTNDINKCVNFLRSKFAGLRFANFYYNTGINKRSIYATWGKIKGFEFN